jgi:hypothetical protein
MIRIYADFNSQDEQGRVLLTTVGSRDDLKRHEHEIAEGTEVLLYMDDVELHGTLVFDDVWMAVPDFDTIRYPNPDYESGETPDR